jgi:outer membrane protein assembly factor BamB
MFTSSPGGPVVSSPAVVNGVVYVCADGIHALNATTGAKLWNHPYPTGAPRSPVYANGVVYVGGYFQTLSTNNGYVYALNANNGTQLWNYTTGSNVVDSSPAAVNGVVYIGSEVSSVNANDGHVYAIGNQTTTLNATAPPTASVNTHFTINGTVSGSTTGIAGATITLQRSTNNAAWKNVATTTTNAVGWHQFTTSESTAHTYYYRTTYAGNRMYTEARSNVLKVTVQI